MPTKSNPLAAALSEAENAQRELAEVQARAAEAGRRAAEAQRRANEAREARRQEWAGRVLAAFATENQNAEAAVADARATFEAVVSNDPTKAPRAWLAWHLECAELSLLLARVANAAAALGRETLVQPGGSHSGAQAASGRPV
jgi:tRNA A37 methylthiotransferase MiaB